MRLSGKLPRWAILAVLIAAGLLLTWLSTRSHWWGEGVLRGTGEAFVVAAVLGFTIDRWFREDFAKDAFYAALGKVLRPEFRDELPWIMSFKLLAVKTHVLLDIDDRGKDVVKITLTIRREVENISPTQEKVRAFMGIDEWTIPGTKSHIEACAIHKGDVETQATISENLPHHLSKETVRIPVDPGEIVTTFTKSVEYKHANDIYMLEFQAPSKDPEVELKISDTLQGTVAFTHRGEMKKEPFFAKRTLKGTYLPGQMLVARWWPKGLK